MNRSANYTLIWNGLDYPACAFPVTKVDPDLDSREDFREFIGEFDKMNFELCTSIKTGHALRSFLPDAEHFSVGIR